MRAAHLSGAGWLVVGTVWLAGCSAIPIPLTDMSIPMPNLGFGQPEVTAAMEPVPYDLAAQIVRHVEGMPAAGELFERWLLRVLTAIFAIAVVAVVAAYGAQWMPAFASLWPSLSPQSADWAGLLVGCLAVSLAWQGVVRLMRADMDMPAGLA